MIIVVNGRFYVLYKNRDEAFYSKILSAGERLIKVVEFVYYGCLFVS